MYQICIICDITCHIFAPRKENEISYKGIIEKSIYLLKTVCIFYIRENKKPGKICKVVLCFE